MISESPLVLIVKRGSGKLRRAAREVHLHQFDVKHPNRGSGFRGVVEKSASRKSGTSSPGSARLMEPFGASGNEAREAKPLKEMVGTRRLELLTSTVSILPG